jgi:hypothetical protein
MPVFNNSFFCRCISLIVRALLSCWLFISAFLFCTSFLHGLVSSCLSAIYLGHLSRGMLITNAVAIYMRPILISHDPSYSDARSG